MSWAAAMIRSDELEAGELGAELRIRGDELLLLRCEVGCLIRRGGDMGSLVHVRDPDPGRDRDHGQERKRCARSATADAQPSDQRFERDVVDAGSRRCRRAVGCGCKTQVEHCPGLQW